MLIFTLLPIFIILSRTKICHSNDEYNASGNDREQFFSASEKIDQFPNYDITYWIRQLQLEHCAFVEIGEDFCALLVEIHGSPFVTKIVDGSYIINFFLGLYSCSILHFSILCSIELTKLRKSNCTCTEGIMYDNTSVGIHRRLCDISLLSTEAYICNRLMTIANQQLHKAEGVLTCFQSQLTKSLCTSHNVCGIAKYSARATNEIHSIQFLTTCHQRQSFCEDAGLWTSMLSVVISSRSQWSSPVCNNICGGLVIVVASCYRQVIEKKAVDYIGPGLLCYPKNLKKYFCKISTTNDTMMAMIFTELCFSIVDCICKDTLMYALKKLNNSQEIEVYYDNNYKEEILLVTPKDVKSMRSLRRRQLQSIDHEYYGNMDCDAQEDKFNFRYARHVGLGMNEDKGENEDEDEDDEDYEVSDEKVDDNLEEGEEENENEEEDEDDEFGHQNLGQQIRMARSNRVVLPYKGKKQKEYLTKENVRIRSITEECNEEPTEELQYYDYETSGIDTLFGSTHKLRIGCFTRFTTMHLLLTFIIWT